MTQFCHYFSNSLIGHFELPNFAGGLQYDLWNTPLTIRTFIVPPTEVTLTLSSEYLDFNPPTLSFTPSSPSAEVAIQLKGLGYARTSDYTISFRVGGADAGLFNTPKDVTFTWKVDATRMFILSIIFYPPPL